LTIADPAPHPASLALIKTTPDACSLVRGKRVLKARLGNGALGTDRLRCGTGRYFFGLWEEHIAVYAITGSFTSPADIGFQCEFNQSQCKPSFSPSLYNENELRRVPFFSIFPRGC
jgi:hypothetical protein